MQTPPTASSCRAPPAASFAVSTLTKHNTIFAIRSGGHSFNAGFSSTSRGVVINLSRLNSVVYDYASNTAKVGPGGTWGDVYRALEPHHITVAGARAAPVGVGGFTNGRGLSFYLYQEGFGSDTVVEYEVVLADGRVITVNKHSHADLLPALKGSGAPFCLVTSFTFRAIPVDAHGVYGGLILSGESSIPGIVDAVADFAQPGAGTSDRKVHLMSIMLMSYNITQARVDRIAANAFFYQTPVTSTPAVY